MMRSREWRTFLTSSYNANSVIIIGSTDINSINNSREDIDFGVCFDQEDEFFSALELFCTPLGATVLTVLLLLTRSFESISSLGGLIGLLGNNEFVLPEHI